MLFKKHITKLFLFFILINLFLFIPIILVQGDNENEDKITFTFAPKGKAHKAHNETTKRPLWQRIETKHTVIQYENLKDLKKFEGKIDYSQDKFFFKGLFFSSTSNDPKKAVNKKVEALFERVQEILDMRTKINKIIINIYPNKNRLDEIYYHITGTKCRIRSWYIYESNTIYINASDVHEGILAHEMAHAIIDHYFSVRPPRVTAEILARYVDEHVHF
jgi:hypothetical protein